jgi:hypothetical protein
LDTDVAVKVGLSVAVADGRGVDVRVGRVSPVDWAATTEIGHPAEKTLSPTKQVTMIRAIRKMYFTLISTG